MIGRQMAYARNYPLVTGSFASALRFQHQGLRDNVEWQKREPYYQVWARATARRYGSVASNVDSCWCGHLTPPAGGVPYISTRSVAHKTCDFKS
jgi:hypothetical protein